MTTMPPQDGRVRFDSEGDEFAQVSRGTNSDSMSDRLVRWGIVSSPEQAQYVLIGLVAMVLIAILYFLKQAFS